MTEFNIRPIVLCGGRGTRLWPTSRKSMPKQFARLSGHLSMLQSTIRRLEDCGCGAPILMTAEDYRFTVADQMAEIASEGHRIVIEPQARKTAPAILAAAELLHAEDPDALMLVAPSDHVISDTLAFGNALAVAAESAREGQIVTFGIRPDRPETGYGYIELLDEPDDCNAAVHFLNFTEKPDTDAAEKMVASGRFLWNSGMFLFSVRSILAAYDKHASSIVGAVKNSVAEARRDLDFCRLGAAYEGAPEISIDYAIMEKCKGLVVPMDTLWSDLGSWQSVWQNQPTDKAGVSTQGLALAMGCQDTLLRSDDNGVQVVGIGLKNIAAIATRDAVLICDLDHSQQVGEAVSQLKLLGTPQAEDFPRHYRPWGYYESLALGGRFQVKAIVVKPGAQLSLQSHMHRAEHWVVVEGSAQVTIGAERRLVGENQSVYVPLGEVHRLANPGRVELRLIEVQTGAYLGEDDIVRYEDVYDRV